MELKFYRPNSKMSPSDHVENQYVFRYRESISDTPINIMVDFLKINDMYHPDMIEFNNVL